MEHFYQNIEGWASEHDQGNLLSTILDLINYKDEIKIAEIGVYKGRGTALWNVELINRNINYQYYAIDHFLGSDEHIKGVDYYTETVNNLQNIIDKIHIIKNDSINKSFSYNDGYFDIVYIDASHDYESVKNDIIAWLPKIKKGGIICGDDYINGWPEVIKAVDEIFSGQTINKVGNQQWWVKL